MVNVASAGTRNVNQSESGPAAVSVVAPIVTSDAERVSVASARVSSGSKASVLQSGAPVSFTAAVSKQLCAVSVGAQGAVMFSWYTPQSSA